MTEVMLLQKEEEEKERGNRMITVSYSRINSYLSCPYSHYLRYVERIVRKGKNRPLSFGSDFHKLLEVRSDVSKVKKVFKKQKEEFYDLDPNTQSDLGDDYLFDLKTIFSDYMKRYKKTLLPDKTETTFEIPIGKHGKEKVVFFGIIDELYNTDDGIMIGEHKTFSRRPDRIFIAMNTQKCLYAKAIQEMTGKLPISVQWDYIKSTPAAEPIWLEKSQKFSEAKSDKITEYSWRRACKKRGISDKEILRKGKELYSGNIHNFFFRFSDDIIPQMVDEIFSGFLYTAEEIVKNGEKNKTRHTGTNCSWCDYKDICYAELTGGNSDYVREKDYRERS